MKILKKISNNIKFKNITFVLFILFLTACDNKHYSEFNINYEDKKISKKLTEIYKNNLKKLDLENYVSFYKNEENIKKNKELLKKDSDFYYTLFQNNLSNEILINYKQYRLITYPSGYYKNKIKKEYNCNVSYIYLNNNTIFKNNEFIFNKEEIIKYGRKEFFNKMKQCLKKDLSLILEKQKENILNKKTKKLELKKVKELELQKLNEKI